MSHDEERNEELCSDLERMPGTVPSVLARVSHLSDLYRFATRHRGYSIHSDQNTQQDCKHLLKDFFAKMHNQCVRHSVLGVGNFLTA